MFHIIRSGVSGLTQRNSTLAVPFPQGPPVNVRRMSRLLIVFLTILLKAEPGDTFSPGQGGLPAGSPQVRGEWVARQADQRDTGRDGRVTFKMRLFDRQERARERALTVLSKKSAAGDKSLTRFTYPADIAGTAFLVWEHPGMAASGAGRGGEAERFLYLPSLARVRRIAGSEAQESFVGSDFTYEDIGGREFDDYAYVLISDTAENGTAYTLESRASNATARFPRVVSVVRKDNFVVIHAEIFNKRGEVQKIFDASRVEKIGRYWTVMAMSMKDTGQKTRTELTVEKAEYDIGLTDDAFTRRELEKAIR